MRTKPVRHNMHNLLVVLSIFQVKSGIFLVEGTNHLFDRAAVNSFLATEMDGCVWTCSRLCYHGKQNELLPISTPLEPGAG